MKRPTIDRSIVFTYTNDLPAASQFFREVLELDFVVDQGPCHIFRLTDESYIGVCDLPDRPSDQAGVTITIVSDDVEGWHEFLTARGVDYVHEPGQSDRFSVFSSLFISPHGYRIEIQRFDDRDWHKRRL
jgi:predicted enzyme related to lactoylglutathione lyase